MNLVYGETMWDRNREHGKGSWPALPHASLAWKWQMTAELTRSQDRDLSGNTEF